MKQMNETNECMNSICQWYVIQFNKQCNDAFKDAKMMHLQQIIFYDDRDRKGFP